MFRFVVILTCLHALCATGAPGAQQPAATTAPSTTTPAATVGIRGQLHQWLTDLSDPDVSRRQTAFDRLLELHRSDLPELRQAAAKFQPLAPSLSIALRQVVIHVFLRDEQYASTGSAGFLGVRLGEVISWDSATGEMGGGDGPRTGVMIAGRMPGFGGYQALRDGDIVVAVIDRPATAIGSLESLRVVIQSFAPGQSIHLQIIRQGRLIRTTAQLDGTPAIADQSTLEELLQRRRIKAEEYWEKNFASLLSPA